MNLAFLTAIGQVFQNRVLDEVKSLKDKKIHVKFLSLEHYTVNIIDSLLIHP